MKKAREDGKGRDKKHYTGARSRGSSGLAGLEFLRI